MNKRNPNLDFLRVLAAFMVVVLHVSVPYVTDNIESPNLYFTIGNFFDSITRISVPIFIMLSGSFLLDNPNNKEYKVFYKKTLKKIILPTLIWSLIYCIYSILLEIFKGITGTDANFLVPFLNWVNGEPFYHLWYMYMIIGLYLVTPVIISIKDDIGDNNTFKLGWVLILLGIIISATSKLFWPIQFVEYLGYFILGYSLRKYYISNYIRPLKYILAAIISGLLVFISTELIARMGWLKEYNQLYFYENLSPFVVIGSICIFIVFINMRNVRINATMENLCKHSFNIYI